MGLYESIEKFLLEKNGTSTHQALFEKFNTSYSKQTIIDVINDNSDVFTLTENQVNLKDFKINFFMKSISDFIKKEQLYGPKQLDYLAVLFLNIRQYGYKEYEPIQGFFGPSSEELIRARSNELFRIISEKDWANKVFVYKLSSQFYSLLLSFSRQNRTLHSTPDTLIELILKFIPSKRKLEIYNPASGILKLLSAIFTYSEANISAYGSEIDSEVFKYGNYLAKANNVHGFIENIDSLNEWKWKSQQYDLIVCNPPFNSKLDTYKRLEFSYSDVSLNLISDSLHNLKSDGVALFLIPDNVLFGSTRELRKFRREIVESGILKTIISLPTNLFAPITSIKTSLLVFDKTWQQNKIQFLDASLKKYYTTKRDKSIKLDTDRIIDRIKPLEIGGRAIVKEALVQYSSYDFKEVSASEIQENKYSLQIRNYTSQYTSYTGKDYKELGLILESIKLEKARTTQFPYIRISELNGDILETDEHLHQNTTRSAGKVLNQQAILIGTVGGSHKPTLFTGNFSAELSNNVLALQPFEENAVFLPYLVQELNQKYVVDQMTYLSVGATTLRHLRRDDLLRVKVKLPDLTTQKQIYESRLGFVSKDSIDQSNNRLTDEELFGTIKHEIGNILRGPDGFLDLLPKFLKNNNVDLDQPIVKMVGAETIGQMIEMSQNNIKQVYVALENLKGVMFSDEKFFNPQKLELRSYFRKKLTAEKFNGVLKWYIGIDGDFKTSKNIFAEFDSTQFDYVIRNICLNVINHGGEQESLILVVNITQTEDNIHIHFINNGQPFPSNFDIEDYISFGKKQGASKGSGLGGYVINQIVKNHNGSLELLPGGESIMIHDGQNDIEINANVDILITIPKKQ